MVSKSPTALLCCIFNFSCHRNCLNNSLPDLLSHYRNVRVKFTNYKDILCLSSYPPAQYFCSAHYRRYVTTQNAPGGRSGRGGRLRKRNQGVSKDDFDDQKTTSTHCTKTTKKTVQYSLYEDDHQHHESTLDDKSYRSIQLKMVKPFAQRPSIP